MTSDRGIEPAVIPAIVYAELLVGVEFSDGPRWPGSSGEVRISGLVAHAPVVTFDSDVARIWARPFAVTALYLVYGVLVGPSDEKHFSGIDGRRVEMLRV